MRLLQGRENVKEDGRALDDVGGELFELLRSGRCDFAAEGLVQGAALALQADLSV